MISATGLQTNAIVVSIRSEQADEFERLFADEELPIWDEFHDNGTLISASLTRVQHGSQEKPGVQDYVILAVFHGMSGHTAHDQDERFNAFLPKVRRLQPSAPFVGRHHDPRPTRGRCGPEKRRVSGARLSHLFVHVRSLPETRRFYVDLLGLEILMEEPGYLRIGNRDGWHMGMEEGKPIGADGIELVIGVDNVDDAYRRLVDAGAVFDSEPQDMEWGARHAWLRDPSGYQLSIYSR